MFELFMKGGIFGMTILTIIFLALLLAAWKAPAWVKEIGIIALVWGVCWALMGFVQMAGAMTKSEFPSGIVWSGLMLATIPLFYGLFIYLVSLIIRIIQKPRI